MKTGKKIMFASLILIIVGTVGIFFSFDRLNAQTYSAEKTLEENFTDLSIDIGNGSVELVPSEDNTARIEMQGLRSEDADEEMTAEVRDNTLVIESPSSFSFFNLDFSFEETKLTVYLPETTYESVMMKTGNGSLSASGFDIETLTAGTDNGAIQLEEMENSRTEAITDNGKIEITEVQGEISGGTDNGNVALRTNALEHSVDLKTDNGRIEIITETKPDNAAFDVQTDNGKTQLFGQESSQETFGEGDVSIMLRSGNGDITVDQ